MIQRMRIEAVVILAALTAAAVVGAREASAKVEEAAASPTLPDAWVNQLRWRSIGPACMGGRVIDIAVYEADPSIWWVATASGGLLKTTNNGTTFEHQFDHESTVSIGDVAVAQSDPAIVWVGTGENNARNSVSWGDGVYKSIDGGKTWKHMGLKESFQIGRMAIHPENPDIVYVGVLGRLWGPNEERGLFKTTDGGETWEKILYVDDKTSIVNLRMHPEDPDTLIVATYERERDGFDRNTPLKAWGPGSGVYRTTDGGASFTEVTEGLPACELGRIGLDYYREDPNIVYAVVESQNSGQEPENAPYMGIEGQDADVGARLTSIAEDGPADAAGLKVGDIVIAMNDETVHSYQGLLKAIRQHIADDTVLVEVSRDRESVQMELTFAHRPGATEDEEGSERPQRGGRPGGQSQRQSRPAFGTMLGGQRQNVQDQQGQDGHEFGGVFRSDDGGVTWKRINSLNPRPMYFSKIRVDPSDNNHMHVLGVSLHRSKDGGETFTSDGGRGVHSDHHAMWIDPSDGRHIILGCDGGVYVTNDRGENWDRYNHAAIGQFYHVGVGPRPDYRVYGGLQDNGSWGGPNRSRSGRGPVNEDWFFVGGGDGFITRADPNDADQIYSSSQNGSLGRYHLGTGERGYMRPRAPRGTRYRFNWKTPYILSNHNSSVYYSAGNYVFRSMFKGENLKVISPDLTTTDQGAATALAECPFDPGVLYAGTNEGLLWRTRNGGHEWINLFDIPEKPAEPEEPKQAEEPAGEGEEAGEEGAAAAEGAGRPARRGPQRGGRGTRMLSMLKELDANEDGMIQEDEVPERMQRMFSRMDENEDGVLDKDEMKAIEQRAAGGQRPPAATAESTEEKSEEPSPEAEPEPEAPAKPAEATAVDDPVSGKWTAKIVGEDVPPGEGEFTLSLNLTAEGNVTGQLQSSIGEGDMSEGKYDASKKELTFAYEAEQMQMTLDFTGVIAKNRLEGSIDMGGMGMSMAFQANRVGGPPTGVAVAADDGDPVEPEPKGKSIDELMPETRWVSSIETSRFKRGRLYVTLDGHRSNDDEPYVFVSEDHGDTWRSIRANLPTSAGSTRVIREDIEYANVLYLGADFSAWVSVDRGESWTKLNSNLPTVAVHEYAQHPTSGEMVAATHGRSLWILDVTPLRQMSDEAIGEKVHLFKPNKVTYWRSEPSRGGTNRHFVGENPQDGAKIFYSINTQARRVSLEIINLHGETVRKLEAESSQGLHQASWDCRLPPPQGRGGSAQGRRSYYRRGPHVEPGRYLVQLTVDNQTLTEELVIQGDPEHPDTVLWGEQTPD